MPYSVEQARQMLERVPEEMEDLRGYLNATVEGILPKYYLGQFLHRRDDFSDDLPLIDVRIIIQGQGSTPESLIQYKCQTNYVLGLCLKLKGVVEDGVITDEDLKREIAGFIRSDLNFQVGDINNPDRLSRMNSILGRTIAVLTSTEQ